MNDTTTTKLDMFFETDDTSSFNTPNEIDIEEYETLQDEITDPLESFDTVILDDVTENYTEPKQKKTRRKHYINGVDMHNALVEWKEQLKTDNTARMSDYIGECFMRIAINRAKHSWYSGYTFKDEMISEAILTMCKYAKNYNPERSDNCFSYFTQFANNAFQQIMMKEKKLADYKFEMVKETQTNSEGFDYNNFFNEE